MKYEMLIGEKGSKPKDVGLLNFYVANINQQNKNESIK